MYAQSECKLSKATRSLWAKSDRTDGEGWLPLFIHACDTAAMGERLWDFWLPRGTKEALALSFNDSLDRARATTIFLCAVHDLGKATPVFQARDVVKGYGEFSSLAWIPERVGLDVRPGMRLRRPTHAIAGEVLLERYLTEIGLSLRVAQSVSSVIGAHHGNPPRNVDLLDASDHPRRLGIGLTGPAETLGWEQAHAELIELARVCAGMDDDALFELERCSLGAPCANVIAGLVIMADWLASNERFFPLIYPEGSDGGFSREGIVDFEGLAQRASRGWRLSGVESSWVESDSSVVSADAFLQRFDLPGDTTIRPVQRKAIETAQTMDTAGMLIVEAPMGEGKTEAALAAAEILSVRSGHGGVCVALPTMATTDAMFGRVHAWINRLPADERDRDTIYLAHGKAHLNEEYQGIISRSASGYGVCPIGIDEDADAAREDEVFANERAEVSSWMCGRKKGMLADFVVCTVDQVLMGALQMRHLSLRQLALANKVVIIDECHAYDTYMQMYLRRVLEWLATMRTPVILLSATLPSGLRSDLADAYRAGLMARPMGGSGAEGLLAALRTDRRKRRGVAASADEGQHGALASQASAEEPIYPVLTAVERSGVRTIPAERSSRSTHVDLQLIDDGLDELADLFSRILVDGGCAAVVCDTVSRAQVALAALSERFPNDELMLVHARFMDCDRMENEAKLRRLLGPASSVANGTRPKRLIVVGTQVLEQSLDIDFDVMVSDIAPIDLVLQRLGRMHRHERGAEQGDRPARVRSARCFVRGVTCIEPVPAFRPGLLNVYDSASLMESLAVLGLDRFDAIGEVVLPDCIAPLVQSAYSSDAGRMIPEGWGDAYRDATAKRRECQAEKKRRSQAYLLAEASPYVRDGRGLDDLFSRNADADSTRRQDDDFGPRAVRDTQESVEVLLLERDGETMRLLPWVSCDRSAEMEGASSQDGYGRVVPIEWEPEEELAATMAQCAVRLPLTMCASRNIDALISSLESHCGWFVGVWQDSGWIAGKLFVALERRGSQFEARIGDWLVSYTREGGLFTVRQDV
ncbi:CRISPR-associated helicase Cas3' [Collinsella tanakaei]|nr:CRISPR-associated helicase Cas3' [Collinsella tanakaei]